MTPTASESREVARSMKNPDHLSASSVSVWSDFSG